MASSNLRFGPLLALFMASALLSACANETLDEPAMSDEQAEEEVSERDLIDDPPRD